MKLRHLAAYAALALVTAAVTAAGLLYLRPGAPRPMAAPPPQARVISWDDLTPKDWDPLKPFRGTDTGALSDSSPRAIEALRDMRAIWDNAPLVTAMDGAAVRLPGYVVPLEEGADGLREFLLVPYFGACIHTPPPPANQIVHVFAKAPAMGFQTMSTVWVDGTLKVGRQESIMGMSGYRLEGASVEAYTAPSPPR